MSAPARAVTGSTVKSGFGWVAFANYTNRLLAIVTTLVLARLLTPDDFGLVAIATMLIEGVQVFKDMGLSEAVIVSRREDRAALDTAHTVLVSYNAVLFLVTIIAAPLVARFYERDVLVVLVPLLSSSLVVNALRAVPLTLIRKELEYRKLALPDLVPTAVSSLVALAMAAGGFGVWSLVAKSVVQSLLAVVVLHYVSPFRPRFAFDRAAAGELFQYGRFIVGASLLFVALYNVDKLFVSRWAGIQALGVYQLAISIAELPIKQLSFLVGAVMFPVFSRMGRTSPDLRDTAITTLKYTACLTLPASVGLAVFGPELVRQMFGSRWEGLDVVMRVLPLYAAFRSLSSIVHDLFKATGQPKLMQNATALKLGAVVLGAVPALSYAGLPGMAALLILVYAAGLVWEISRLAPILDTTVLHIVRPIVTPAVLASTILPGTYLGWTLLGGIDGPWKLGAAMVVAGLGYVAALFGLEPRLAQDLGVLRGSRPRPATVTAAPGTADAPAVAPHRDAPAAAPHRDGLRRVWPWLALLAVITRAPFLFRDVIDWDESTFIVMGKALMDGHLPYLFIWDNKPPLIFFLFALVVGAPGEPVIVARITGLVFAWLTSTLVYALARRLGSHAGAATAAALYLVALGTMGSGQATTSELLSTLPVLASVGLLSARPSSIGGYMLLGALLSAATLIRMNLALTVVAVGLLVLLAEHQNGWRRCLRMSAAYAAGGLAILIALLAPYVAANATTTFWYSVFEAPFLYASTQSGPLANLKQQAFNALGLRLGFNPGQFAAGLAIWVPAGLAMVSTAGRWRAMESGTRWTWMVLLTVAGATGVSIVMSGVAPLHYLIGMVPFAAVLAGTVWGALWDRGRPAAVGAAVGILALVMLQVPASEYRLLAERLVAGRGLNHGSAIAIADYLGPRCPRACAVYFMEDHLGYVLLDKYPPRKIVTHPSNIAKPSLLNAEIGAASTPDEEMRRVLATSPDFIVKPDRVWYLLPSQEKILGADLAGRYRLAAEIAGRQVYERVTR